MHMYSAARPDLARRRSGPRTTPSRPRPGRAQPNRASPPSATCKPGLVPTQQLIDLHADQQSRLITTSALSCLSLFRSARVQQTRLRPQSQPLTRLPTTRLASTFAKPTSQPSPSVPAYTSKNVARAARPSPSPSPAQSPSPSTPANDSMQLDPSPIRAPASSGAHEIPTKVGDFELLATGQLEFAPITVSKWVSQKSGLKVVYADVESPLVQAYMPIVTEIFDDTGRPHTLEHLVSRSPYYIQRRTAQPDTVDHTQIRSLWEARNTLTRESVSKKIKHHGNSWQAGLHD